MTSSWYEKFKREKERKQGTREAKPRLILCFEDGQSAPSYFEAYRIDNRLTKKSFIVDFNSSVTDPLSVVKRAIEKKEYLVSNKEFVIEEGDQVWAIVDVDRHETLRKAIQLAKDNDIKLAISNPCFEYWILLHFEDCAPHISICSELISKCLKKYIPKYDKGSTDFSKIVEKAAIASNLAEKNFKAKAEPDPVKCCPCTQIYELINMIQKHIG